MGSFKTKQAFIYKFLYFISATYCVQFTHSTLAGWPHFFYRDLMNAWTNQASKADYNAFLVDATLVCSLLSSKKKITIRWTLLINLEHIYFMTRWMTEWHCLSVCYSQKNILCRNKNSFYLRIPWPVYWLVTANKPHAWPHFSFRVTSSSRLTLHAAAFSVFWILISRSLLFF